MTPPPHTLVRSFLRQCLPAMPLLLNYLFIFPFITQELDVRDVAQKKTQSYSDGRGCVRARAFVNIFVSTSSLWTLGVNPQH